MKLKGTSEIVEKLGNFRYFDEWDEATLQECCRISKIKSFQRDEIVLGKNFGQSNYVYFITDGFCQVLQIDAEICCRKIGDAENKDRPRIIRAYILSKLACFNIGENLDNREIVSCTNTQCILIPYYWLMGNNIDNIWTRTQKFLNAQIPSAINVYKKAVEDRTWSCYKKELCNRDRKRNTSGAYIYHVPFSIRIANAFPKGYCGKRQLKI